MDDDDDEDEVLDDAVDELLLPVLDAVEELMTEVGFDT